MAELVIELERTKAQRIMLEERLKAQRDVVQREIDRARADSRASHDALIDFDLMELTHRDDDDEIRQRPSTVAKRSALNLQLEIEELQEKLSDLTKALEAQKRENKSEIDDLLKEVRRKKRLMEKLVALNTEMEQENEEKLLQIREMKREIRSCQEKTTRAKAERETKEQRIKEMTAHAERIVAQVYRGKSKYCGS